LVQQGNINLSAKLRARLIQELNNLLRHVEGSAVMIDRTRCNEQDLSNKVTKIMIGRKGSQ
jgi:hypothetical protein